MSDNRRSRFPVKLALLTVIAAGSYIHGLRIVSLAETPSSKRPWSIVLNGELQPMETSYNKSDADWLSQLTK